MQSQQCNNRDGQSLHESLKNHFGCIYVNGTQRPSLMRINIYKYIIAKMRIRLKPSFKILDLLTKVVCYIVHYFTFLELPYK